MQVLNPHNLHLLARALFEQSDHALFLLDPASERVLEANGRAQRLSGFSRAALVRLSVGQLFRGHGEGGLQRLRQACRRGEVLHSQERFWLRHRQDGVWVPVRLSLARLATEPRPLGLMTARAVPERGPARPEKSEAGLGQAQKLEALGQLAGGVAHDFNNLLTVILGNLALVVAGLPAGDPNRELAEAAEKAALQGAALTGQLLGFSRQAALRPRPTDLNGVVHEVLGLLRRTIDPRVVIEARPAAGLWAVQADPGPLHQVLMNLCLNARDAMPEGGRLLLETDNVVVDEGHARGHGGARPGEYVRLRVRDTGYGIPAEVRARVFEPFFTTKEPGKGTGLGLALVFGIVQQHQGWVHCDSEVGRGTCFHVYLPRARDAGGRAPAGAPAPAPGRGTETVLLADDEAALRNLGRTILERYGYAVLTAEDGLEAVEVYRQNGGRIALVILDLTMPVLCGRDAFHMLREIDPRVKVLLASGYSADHALRGAGEQALGFVHKPYRPEELARVVRAALDKRPAEEARKG